MFAFSESLKRFCREHHLTQKEIDDAIGIKKNVYQAYEYGKSLPSISVVAKLADAYNVSIDYLTGRTDNPNVHGLETNTETQEDLIDKVFLMSRNDRNAKGLTNAEMDYANTMLRNYHKLVNRSDNPNLLKN